MFSHFLFIQNLSTNSQMIALGLVIEGFKKKVSFLVLRWWQLLKPLKSDNNLTVHVGEMMAG